MALDDARTLGEQKDTSGEGEGKEEKEKGFTDSLFETFSVCV